MDKNYVAIRREIVLATIKAMHLIRAIEAQIRTAGAVDDEGRPVPNPFGERLTFRVSPEEKEQIGDWIDAVVRAARDAYEAPSDEALETLEVALSHLRAGEQEMAYADAMKWVLTRAKDNAHPLPGSTKH